MILASIAMDWLETQRIDKSMRVQRAWEIEELNQKIVIYYGWLHKDFNFLVIKKLY